MPLNYFLLLVTLPSNGLNHVSILEIFLLVEEHLNVVLKMQCHHLFVHLIFAGGCNVTSADKISTILLYALELTCPLLSRQRHSLESTVNRILTGSPLVVTDCLFYFNFSPIIHQFNMHCSLFLQKFLTIENIFCCLFSVDTSIYSNRFFSHLVTTFILHPNFTIILHLLFTSYI